MFSVHFCTYFASIWQILGMKSGKTSRPVGQSTSKISEKISSLTNEKLTVKSIFIFQKIWNDKFLTPQCACTLGVWQKYYQKWQILWPLWVSTKATVASRDSRWIYREHIYVQGKLATSEFEPPTVDQPIRSKSVLVNDHEVTTKDISGVHRGIFRKLSDWFSSVCLGWPYAAFTKIIAQCTRYRM